MKPNGERVAIRCLTEIEEFEELSRLERRIRGYSDLDAMPVRVYTTNTKRLGGQLFGAFDGAPGEAGRLIGYCLSVPGFGPGEERFLYGFGIAVAPEYRDAGIGRRLKFAQREDALRRGIRRMEWAFDPLMTKNAYFNLEVLGAVVRGYELNYQGINSLPDSAGLPTDVCIADWEMDSRRVEAILAGAPLARPPVAATIEIPARIAEIKRRDPRLAREIQQRASSSFLRYFDTGLEVTGFQRTPGVGVYLLSRR